MLQQQDEAGATRAARLPDECLDAFFAMVHLTYGDRVCCGARGGVLGM